MSSALTNIEQKPLRNSLTLQAQAEYEYRIRTIQEQREDTNRETWEREQELKRFYREHPIDWIVDKLGVKREMIDWTLLPEYQKHQWDGTPNPYVTALNALLRNQWVAIEGATGVSKTFLAACIALWFFDSFENAMVVTTAPKEKQLELHVWKDIGRLHPRYGKGHLQTLTLQMVRGKEDWSIQGFVAGVGAGEESATKAQGFHAEHLLIIVEETPGVSNAIMTALQNTCVAPHNLIMALGNPDNQFDTLHQFSKQQRVQAVTVSGFDFPNVVLRNPNFIPGGQSEQGLAGMLDRYKNEKHPMYLSRARGLSPQQAKDALIKYNWLEQAAQRRSQFLDESGRPNLKKIPGRFALGVDVANSEDGDEGAICRGKGMFCIEVESFPCPNSNELGTMVHGEMTSRKIEDGLVGVDGVGVGAGTVNELKRLGREVVNIISSEAADPLEEETEEEEDGKPVGKKRVELAEKFKNLRAKMWWQVMMDLRAGNLILPHDEVLFADLMTPKWFTRNGVIVLESKEDIRKRLGRSPNKGDAFVYWNWVRTLRSATAAGVGLKQRSNSAPEPQPKTIRDVPRGRPLTITGTMKRSF